jgi:hypothetical protein
MGKKFYRMSAVVSDSDDELQTFLMSKGEIVDTVAAFSLQQGLYLEGEINIRQDRDVLQLDGLIVLYGPGRCHRGLLS